MTKWKKKHATAGNKAPSTSTTKEAIAPSTPPTLAPKNDPKRTTTAQIQQKLPFAAATVVVPHTGNFSPNEDPAVNSALSSNRSVGQPRTPSALRTHVSASVPTRQQTQTPGVTASNEMTAAANTALANINNRQSLRYRVTIEVKEHKDKQPLEAFADNFKVVFRAIQKIAGEHLWLCTWDEEQELSGFPPIKHKDELPDGSKPERHRNIFNIYTNTYINPKKEGSKIWLLLRFAHEQPIRIELPKLGEAVQDSFTDLPFDVRFNRHPNHCQSSSVECLGWLYGSTKTISEPAFSLACRKALEIPDQIAFGLQWRTITDRLGKRPPFDQDNPPPSALHLDIDKRFAHAFQKKAGALWRKYDKQKDRPALPHDIQLRLVPCFSSEFSDARKTPKTEENVVLMAGKQKFFVTQYIQKIEVHFIRFLDTPLSETNDITLRRALMARSPKADPTKRLIHNVDFFWNDAHRVHATTITHLRSQTQDFLATLIPEMVFRYGQECQKWFTEDGLTYFENVTWDPNTLSTTSEADKTTQALVDEDLWDLGDDWKVASTPRQDPQQIGTSVLKQKQNKNKNKVTTRQLENDDDIRSFASAFGTEHASETSPPGEDTGQTNSGATVKLTGQVLARLNATTPRQQQDNLSMSTAAKTTDSTRVRLHVAKSTISQQTSLINSQAVELERLRQLLQAQNQENSGLMDVVQEIEVEVDSALLQPPNPDTDNRSAQSRTKRANPNLEVDINRDHTIYLTSPAVQSPAPSIQSITSSQPDAPDIPLPDSPKDVIDLQSHAGSSTPPPRIAVTQDMPSSIAAPFGDEFETISATDDDTIELVTNLRSKFSAAKLSSVEKKTSSSPPKKVRFTAAQQDAQEASVDDSSSTDAIPPSVGFTAHDRPTDPPAVVDSVDDGHRA